MMIFPSIGALLPDSSHQYNAVLVAHAGEIGIKARNTRRFMVSTLHHNITKKCSEFSMDFKNISNRSIILTDSPIPLAEKISSIIFGVSYTAPIYLFSWTDYDQLVSVLLQFSQQHIQSGQTFGFSARANGPRRPSTNQLKIELGAKLYDLFNGSITVNLTSPDILFEVEVREDHAWIYYQTFHGLDGFPQGSQKNFLFAYIRPWLPDYLACFLVMKRGVTVQPVRFLPEPGFSPAYDSWHDFFIHSFSSRRIIDIPLFTFLEKYKDIFGKHLCTACIFFSERLLSSVSGSDDRSGFISGVQHQSLLGDINNATLEWLEKKTNVFKVRPLLFLNTFSLVQSNNFQSFPREDSCCKFQSKRFLSIPDTIEELTLFEENLMSLESIVIDFKNDFLR